MRIAGQWYECDDGVVRPVIRGEVLAVDGSWKRAEFLVDTGADRTVLSATLFARLGFEGSARGGTLGGVGGVVDSFVVQTEIRLTREQDHKVLFRSEYAALAEAETLDMSVLGRDITNLFAVIVDRPNNTVCLIGRRHSYQINEP